jgi:hypothetical protein
MPKKAKKNKIIQINLIIEIYQLIIQTFKKINQFNKIQNHN